MSVRETRPTAWVGVALLVIGCGKKPDVEHVPLTAGDCWTCHSSAWRQSTNPAHEAGEYATTCADCHTKAAWRPAGLPNHDDFFVLKGRHLDTTCAGCHDGTLFHETPTSCVGCHLADYESTTSPNHSELGLSLECQSCHDEFGWQTDALGDHDEFPLVGKHAFVPCADCHTNGYDDDPPETCDGCHMTAYEATTAPDHQAVGISTQCQGCHTPWGWTPADGFDHGGFELLGKHTSVPCSDCHTDGYEVSPPQTCLGCHLPAYEATEQPDHEAAGIGTTCETCHTAHGWSPAELGDHDDYWPLEGKHEGAACAGCHEAGVYTGTPTICQDCHTPDWEASMQPNHQTTQLPKTCIDCHTPAGWSPAALPDHDAITQGCVGCHQGDWDGSVNPNHDGAGIGTDCETCHVTTTWDTLEFPGHDSISKGNHKNYGCADCHVTTQWAQYTCIDCHDGEHTLSKMNAKHKEEGGYASTLAAAATPDQGCNECH